MHFTSNGTTDRLKGDTNVMYGFLSGGVCLLLSGLLMLGLHCIFDGVYIHGQKTSENVKKAMPRELVPLRIGIVVLLIVYFVSQSVILRTYANFIMTFSVNWLRWEKSKGAALTSTYHAATVVSKFVMIFLVRFLSIETILFIGLLFCNIASLGLCFIEAHESLPWIFSILLGIAISLPLAVLLGWIDKYVGLRGQMSVLHSTSGSVGEVIVSPVIGYLMAEEMYRSYMFLILGSSVMCLLTMVVLQVLGQTYKRKEVALASQHLIRG